DEMSARAKIFSFVFGLALALSCAALAQQSGGGSAATPNAPTAQSAAATAPAVPANYDAHDLSGVWNMAFPPGASQQDLEIYVSQFGKEEPPMTPWAKERFDKTKPAFGK